MQSSNIPEQSFRIGSLQLKNRYLLAPLAGISDSSFRCIAARQGASLVYTEMVSAKAMDQKNRNTKELLRFTDEEKPIGVQLFGHEPDVMERTVAALEPCGFDLIDINMGCPVPKVFKNGEGSALMKDPKLACALVAAACRQTQKPVTVKMRIGIDSEHVDPVGFAKRLEDAGAAAVTVHGRTREQYYSGPVHRDVIRDIKKELNIPVIGNGDVKDPASAQRMFEETGCDAVMIGRGAIGNPWVFGQLIAAERGDPVSKASFDDKEAMLLEQARLSVAEHGEPMGICRLRGTAGWYFKGMRGAAQIRDMFHQVSTYEELKETLDKVRLLTQTH
ncbi:MAG: tRNA dihydrouridine synthase DusB [Lachnospiraceae bacterium]|nr:tRNA dihydrouridine synthase DusB [Lachnospiraceae bacterium]